VESTSEIVVTPEMLLAGLDELQSHSYAEDLPYILETVFRAMAYKSPQLPSRSEKDTPMPVCQQE
jgi:hypothetical protein